VIETGDRRPGEVARPVELDDLDQSAELRSADSEQHSIAGAQAGSDLARDLPADDAGRVVEYALGVGDDRPHVFDRGGEQPVAVDPSDVMEIARGAETGSLAGIGASPSLSAVTAALAAVRPEAPQIGLFAFATINRGTATRRLSVATVRKLTLRGDRRCPSNAVYAHDAQSHRESSGHGFQSCDTRLCRTSSMAESRLALSTMP
jgi:hypothetical protein